MAVGEGIESEVHDVPQHLIDRWTRRERVFLILAGVFLGAMAMLNIIGITRFIHIGVAR